jgi:hypothetical protein
VTETTNNPTSPLKMIIKSEAERRSRISLHLRNVPCLTEGGRQ